MAQAALGAAVVVPTLDGKVSYPVHEGTQPGAVFKLKGNGIQRLNGRGKGDQYVRVTIAVPKNLNAKQKNLIKEFENVTNEKNYAPVSYTHLEITTAATVITVILF